MTAWTITAVLVTVLAAALLWSLQDRED